MVRKCRYRNMCSNAKGEEIHTLKISRFVPRRVRSRNLRAAVDIVIVAWDLFARSEEIWYE